MSIKQIFYANSTYSFFCYVLDASKRQGCSMKDLIDNTLFVVGPALKDIQIPEENKVLFDLEEPVQSITQKIYHKGGKQLLDKNFPWYINARTPNAGHFISYRDAEGKANSGNYKENVFIITDGLSDHDTFPELVKLPNIKKCYSSPDVVGNVKSEKIKYFNAKDLWEKCPQSDKQLIANIFQVSGDDLAKASSRPVLLVTQPMAEDSMMSEADKIKIYRGIVSNYGAENVILKPHPREKTDWTKIFPGMPVIPRQIPMELLSKMAKLERVATFFSTAAFGTLPDDKVDFYSADFRKLKFFHPDTLDENGYKSVAVSDIEETYRPIHNCNWLRIPDADSSLYRNAVVAKSAVKGTRAIQNRTNQRA